MAGYDTIAFYADKCDGCMDCITACSSAKGGTPRLSIHPASDGKDGFEIAICRQCGEPKCVMNCPAAALTKDMANGVIDWDGSKCVNCLLCTVGCTYAGIAYADEPGHVVKCDTCEGDPACVKSCDKGALQFLRSGRIYNEWGEKEDLFVPGLSACQGCNSELIIRHTLRRIGDNVVVATPPGCIPGMGTVGYNGKTGTKVPVFHPLLTNAASMLAGLKRHYARQGRDDIIMLALAGDGGSSDVGFQALSGAATRNEKILYVCVDNEGYMNTGMQASACTSYGSWTSTTPVGSVMKGHGGESKQLPLVMMMHNVSYVATASLAFMDDFYAKLDKAIETVQTRGFAYLHLYSPCPSGWRVPSDQVMEVCRKGVETNFSPLWQFTPEDGLSFTLRPAQQLPVQEYLSRSGKYKHMNEDMVEHVQATVDERIEFLSRFVKPQAEKASA